jgi:hypothetical protein
MEKHLQRVQHLKRKWRGARGADLGQCLHSNPTQQRIGGLPHRSRHPRESRETDSVVDSQSFDGGYRKVHSHINGNCIRPRIALYTTATMEDRMSNIECFMADQSSFLKGAIAARSKKILRRSPEPLQCASEQGTALELHSNVAFASSEIGLFPNNSPTQ